MNRGELTLAIAAALVAAVLLGWILRWIFTGLNAGGRDRRQATDLAGRMHAAEEAQARAERRLADVEGDLRARVGELEDELARTQDLLDAAQAEVEEVRAAYRRATAADSSPGV